MIRDLFVALFLLSLVTTSQCGLAAGLLNVQQVEASLAR